MRLWWLFPSGCYLDGFFGLPPPYSGGLRHDPAGCPCSASCWVELASGLLDLAAVGRIWKWIVQWGRV